MQNFSLGSLLLQQITLRIWKNIFYILINYFLWLRRLFSHNHYVISDITYAPLCSFLLSIVYYYSREYFQPFPSFCLRSTLFCRRGPFLFETMSHNCCRDIIKSLRFYLKSTRSDHLETAKFGVFSYIWIIYKENCAIFYQPGEY